MDVDVAIVGAGLVGASVAAALSGSGMKIALVEHARPALPSEGWDPRIYTLSPASVGFLQSLGVWGGVDPRRVTPIHAMQVFGDAPGSRLEFSAYDSGIPALAATVESGRLAQALRQVVANRADITLLSPVTPRRLEFAPDRVRLELDAGEPLAARLCIGADGMNSWVRREAGFEISSRSYEERGVIANLEADLPHRNTAFQWFRADGVLAWLPVGENLISIVWSTPDDHAAELLALPPHEFCAAVARAGEDRLGALRMVTPPASFPLVRLSAARRVGQRVALLGDAAHVVHPLAGQGLNLGFGDAQALARVLRGAIQLDDPGAYSVLRRFERERAEDTLAMRWVTDGLHRLFGSAHPAVRRIRNLGLNLTNSLPALKTLLARRAIGRPAETRQ